MGGGGAGGGSLTNNLAGASVSTSAPLHQLWYEDQRKCTWIKTETQHSRHSAIPQSDFYLFTQHHDAGCCAFLGAQEMSEQHRCIHPFNFPLNFPPTSSTSLPKELGVPSQSPVPHGQAHPLSPVSAPGAVVNIAWKMLFRRRPVDIGGMTMNNDNCATECPQNSC